MADGLRFDFVLTDETPAQSGTSAPSPAAPPLSDVYQQGPTPPQLADLRGLDPVPVTVMNVPLATAVAGTVNPATLGPGGTGASAGAVRPVGEGGAAGGEIPYAADRRLLDEPGGVPGAPRSSGEALSLPQPSGPVSFGDILKEWARQSLDAVAGKGTSAALGGEAKDAAAELRAEMDRRAREDEEPDRDFDPVTRRPKRRGPPDAAGQLDELEEVGGRRSAADRDFFLGGRRAGDMAKRLGSQAEAEGGSFRAAGNLPGFGGAAEGAAGGAEAAAGAGEAAGLAGEIGIAAEAGPAAPIVLAAEEAKKAILGAVDAVGDGAKELGNVVSRAAGNDNFGALAEVSHNVAEGLNKLGPVGELAGHALETVTKTAEAFNQMVDSFVARGKELAQYDVGLSQANAMAEVRGLLEDLKEAQTLSEPLSRLTEAQSQASAELRELLLPIKEWIIEKLADIMEFIVTVLRDAKATWDIMREVLVGIMAVLADAFGPSAAGYQMKNIPGDIAGTYDAIKKILRKLEESDEDKEKITWDMQINQLLNQLPAVRPPGIGDKPPPVPANFTF